MCQVLKKLRVIVLYTRSVWLLFPGGLPTLVLALGGVQLPLPVLQLF